MKYGIKLEDIKQGDWVVYRNWYTEDEVKENNKSRHMVGQIGLREGMLRFGLKHGGANKSLLELSVDGVISDMRYLEDPEIPAWDYEYKHNERIRAQTNDDKYVIMNYCQGMWTDELFDTKEDAVKYLLDEGMNPYNFSVLRASVDIHIKYLLDDYIVENRVQEISLTQQLVVAEEKFDFKFDLIIDSNGSEIKKVIHNVKNVKITNGWLSAKQEDYNVGFGSYKTGELVVHLKKKEN